MPGIAVNIAVIHEGKILLTKREDFEVWCLPGGGVEEGRINSRGGHQRNKRRDGLDVELTSLVGVYSRLEAIRQSMSMPCCMQRNQLAGN